MIEPVVANVSDTARWVAAYRARESARPDALFRDPLAERLAGERGPAIAAMAPRPMRSGWPMVARTKLIDDLIAGSLGEGCDRVINLAAGLDTRPYRMALSNTLSWIEADLPALIEEKERVLAGETPVCRLTRERVDLSDPVARTRFLDRALVGASRALVLSEGLTVYLEDATVRALSQDLRGREAIHTWILDLASPRILRIMQQGMGGHLTNAPMRFAPANGVAFFEDLGWRSRDILSIFHAAGRFRRLPFPMSLFTFFPQPNPRAPGNKPWSAVVRLERGTSPPPV